MLKGHFYQLLLGLAVIMMFVPTFLYFQGTLQQPPMWEGDELVVVTCPECEGVASDKECKFCRDRGEVSAVKPGPNRPLYLVGTVLGTDGQPVQEASVVVDTWADPLSFETSEEGQFGVKLPPGTYHISVTGPDNQTVSKDVVFPENQELIYLPAKFEMGGLLHELDETFTFTSEDIQEPPVLREPPVEDIKVK